MPHLQPYYSKREKRAILGLLAVLGVCAAIMWRLAYSEEPDDIATADSLAYRGSTGDTLRHKAANRNNAYGSLPEGYHYAQPSSRQLFPFDPNTADSTQLLRLGLAPWQVASIYKYRAKGGVYRTEKDFAKVYKMTEAQFLELRPYIRISPSYTRPATQLFAEEPHASGMWEGKSVTRDTVKYPKKISTGDYVTLNVADTSQLKRVPGIGSYYAAKIVRYGNWLGGYVSVDQLDEIEIPGDVKPYLRVDTTRIRKINVNTSTLEQLKRHPYINYYQARAIVDYRKRYGAIRHIDDLRMNPDMSLEVRERIAPYLEY